MKHADNSNKIPLIIERPAPAGSHPESSNPGLLHDGAHNNFRHPLALENTSRQANATDRRFPQRCILDREW
jgi:hypothetical protein